MGPSDAVRRCLTSGYAAFSGRARRSEFWWFALFAALMNALAAQIDAMLGWGSAGLVAEEGGAITAASAWIAMGPVGTLTGLILVIPNIAVAARRLHDAGRSGWWLFVLLVPLVGFLILLWFWTRPSDPEPNRFGPPPGADRPASDGPRAAG